FTDCVISRLSSKYQGIVFLLWGNYAISKKRLIDETKHLVLTSVHPSPLSAYRGFIGCRHFSKANQYLTSIGKTPIEW
ncbi:MAG: uracil-DNA glycosylase, partial [Muribaculaceae bacterium]|nr:uracil-DNA glycosylase [Muribaculaceae bacterium]